MEIKKKDLQREIETMLSKKYKSRLEDTDMIILCKKTDSYILKFDCRLQFDSFLRFNPFTIQLNKLENFVYDLIIEELKKYYCNDIGFVIKDFYKTDYSFSQEITSEAHLEEFLSEFYKCLSYYEQEVFPKLLDIKFLADYVGSVPFDKQLEIVVGGTYPVTLFKKIAILKWGNHPRYEEYKNGLQTFIKEDFLEPRYEKEAPLYQQGFDYLITHLENEPNPFIKE
ncbi:hypothetical protein [Capnocytophaga leadbetteri]|uniref:hypothetical protein n=1 Tax=Capnocytophaga leadbetteri TaxID=327575 RepID=UPI0026EA5193|nr:hypothetical protein [Capnocytophaga leadbetteri]